MTWASEKTYPLARKHYMCAACLTCICPGTRHCKWAWADGRDFGDTRVHQMCRALGLGIDQDGCDDEYNSDGVNDFLDWLEERGISVGTPEELEDPDFVGRVFLDAVRMFDFLAGLARLVQS